MKVLHITPYYEPAYIYGGPITSVGRLTKELSCQNTTVTVWTTNANGTKLLDIEPNRTQNVEGVSVCYFSVIGSPKFFFSLRLLIELFKKINSFDIVHVHTWWNLTAMPAVFIAYLCGIKPILSIRGMLSDFSFQNNKSFVKKIFHSIIGRFLLSKTILHATSNREKEECLLIIPNWKYFVAPNFIFFAENAFPLANTNATTLHFIFLSRIHPVKGLELLFKCLSQLTYSWHLSLIGKGEVSYVQTIKNLAITYSMDNKIQWINWIDGNEKYKRLAEADVLLQPSITENFANTVLESLSVGTSVLVSNQVGLSDYVEANNFGWVVELNTTSLMEALNDAYKNQAKRLYIRQKAPFSIRKDFSTAQIIGKYLEAYQNIVS